MFRYVGKCQQTRANTKWLFNHRLPKKISSGATIYFLWQRWREELKNQRRNLPVSGFFLLVHRKPMVPITQSSDVSFSTQRQRHRSSLRYTFLYKEACVMPRVKETLDPRCPVRGLSFPCADRSNFQRFVPRTPLALTLAQIVLGFQCSRPPPSHSFGPLMDVILLTLVVV